MGDPVAHSLSPVIHNAAFEEMGLDADYVAIRADTIVLGETLFRLRSGEFSGLNITMPLKSEAARLVDVLADDAGSGRSVNTIALEAGVIRGYSTDVSALRALLEGWWPDVDSVYVLGSGGAAWAAADAASDRVLYVGARDPARAETLAQGHPDASVVPWGVPVAGAVVVNATPIGMSGESLPDGIVDAAAGLVDLPYGPRGTPAITLATHLGLPFVDGIEFLVAQAGDAIRIWAGVEAPIPVMLRAARNV